MWDLVNDHVRLGCFSGWMPRLAYRVGFVRRSRCLVVGHV